MKKVGYLLLLLLVFLMAWAIYMYLYKDHRDIASEKGSFDVSADFIYQEFTVDEQKANAKYLDKTIEVSGTISKIDTAENTIVIDEKMFVSLEGKIPTGLKEAQAVKVKGRFLGYDELLGEMKMDQSTILNN
ncbi:OB-fold protein [Flavobacterium pedocola]